MSAPNNPNGFCKPCSSDNKRAAPNDGPPPKKARVIPAPMRRVPCKARNMPNSHYEDTAYFDIPASAKHGMLLACSHPACSANGTRRRFRYCAVCHVPVSKRNFVKRHSHGILPPRTIALPPSVTVAAASGDDSETEDIALLRATKEDVSTAFVPDVNNDSLPSVDVASMPNKMILMPEHEKNWLNLLYDCPKNKDPSAMNTWLQQVVAAATKTESQNAERDQNVAATTVEQTGRVLSKNDFQPEVGEKPDMVESNMESVPPAVTEQQPLEAPETGDPAEVSDTEGSVIGTELMTDDAKDTLDFMSLEDLLEVNDAVELLLGSEGDASSHAGITR